VTGGVFLLSEQMRYIGNGFIVGTLDSAGKLVLEPELPQEILYLLRGHLGDCKQDSESKTEAH
jgi:hypothetical protein